MVNEVELAPSSDSAPEGKMSYDFSILEYQSQAASDSHR